MIAARDAVDEEIGMIAAAALDAPVGHGAQEVEVAVGDRGWVETAGRCLQHDGLRAQVHLANMNRV